MKLKILLLVFMIPLMIVNLHGQKNNKKFTVSGYVMDASKNPVAGAMILVDKKNTGKVTDSEGFYKIKVRSDAGKISIFTFTGGTGEALIEGRTTINFFLDRSSSVQENSRNEDKDDEVVNIGYGATRKKDLTLPVNQIDASGTSYSSYSNIYDLLRGTLPGVQVAGKSIIIRGVSTNSSGTEPLFVVDGTIVQSIDEIQPSMVESIQVLKGASASIYGSRGANGVIMITTINAGKSR